MILASPSRGYYIELFEAETYFSVMVQSFRNGALYWDQAQVKSQLFHAHNATPVFVTNFAKADENLVDPETVVRLREEMNTNDISSKKFFVALAGDIKEALEWLRLRFLEGGMDVGVVEVFIEIIKNTLIEFEAQKPHLN